MKPGVELDGLVAEQVMGLEVRQHEPAFCVQGGFQCLKCGRRSDYEAGDVITGICALPYSTDIAAALEVVEKLNGEGGAYSLLNDDDVHWALVSDGMQPIQEGGKAPGAYTYIVEEDDWCDTAPHAICLAALKAVGYEAVAA